MIFGQGGKYVQFKQHMASAQDSQYFEVFYTLDGVNAWLECSIIDIHITQQHKLFKVYVSSPIKSLREREITVDRTQIRGFKHHDESQQAAQFKIGEHVEVFTYPNNPHVKQSDTQGWRSGRVSNVKSKFVSLEFDHDRHPDQLPEIFTANRLRHLSTGNDPAFIIIDSLGRHEITLSAQLSQWITQLLTSHAEFEHERNTFYDQLHLLQTQSEVYSIAPVRSVHLYDKIVVLGGVDKLKRAAIQVNVLLNSQKSLLEKLFASQYQNNPQIANQFQVVREVFVDNAVVTLILGPGSQNIRKLTEQYGVSIQVEKGTFNGDKRKIIVSGRSEQEVAAAAEQIALEKVFIAIDSTLIEHVCGENDQNLEFFRETSGIIQIDVDQDKLTGNYSIVAVGTRGQIDDLRHVVQTHINLYEKAQERKAPEQARKVFYQPPQPTHHQQAAAAQQQAKPKQNVPTPAQQQQYRKK
ncbi:hypothetical protein FGO68_gene10829 [Halteria grandinella]|uniref:K Homology domain-containing protein n=1 Tax=Halteria grandinella TaxID=5974 RepID=A0A8J8NQW1_HALGN|nr:hypothetical protein FGO68_gene10829 [Halteria grandinella]